MRNFITMCNRYLSKIQKKGRVLERSLKEMSHIFFILEKDFFLEMTESKHSPITYPYD